MTLIHSVCNLPPPLQGLHYSRPFWTGMFAIATLLFMIASEAFLAGEYPRAGAGRGVGRGL